MPEVLGRSVCLSESNGMFSETAVSEGMPVFLSLHREEEMDGAYKEKMTAFCSHLSNHGCRILADISKRTLQIFEVPDAETLMDQLNLYAVRLDYEFTEAETIALAAKRNVIINASTITESEMEALKGNPHVKAMHNFYPRPETGMDEAQLKRQTDRLHQYGFKVYAFIPGTGEKRGPLREGLPTLEAHRTVSPLAAFADLALHYEIDEIVVGDPQLSDREDHRIRRFLNEGILEVECRLEPGQEGLYEQVFTNRIDSPDRLIRIAESREYSVSNGTCIQPEHTRIRNIGSITMDNEGYGRYCGEIMIARTDLPADPRVNVIGQVSEKDLLLLNCIAGGKKFVFVKE
ncbi:MAG: DUF871 domain-containing protein [Solobacterium sp.]|nr:DUF871 domain-containing protein [Solobacterium sp.]